MLTVTDLLCILALLDTHPRTHNHAALIARVNDAMLHAHQQQPTPATHEGGDT